MRNRRRRALADPEAEGDWFREGFSEAPSPQSLAQRDRLIPFLSASRLARMEEVLAHRTDRLLLVLDNLHDAHNLSAILRTAEAMGLQHVLLTGGVPEGVNPQVSRGAQRWLTVRRERDAAAARRALKASGFTIVATLSGREPLAPETFHPTAPVALVMGNEHQGLDRAWIEGADACLAIPHRGFTQSLNVSVAAAVLLYALLQKPALSERGLPPAEAETLRALWVRKSVPHASRILRHLEGAGAAEPV